MTIFQVFFFFNKSVTNYSKIKTLRYFKLTPSTLESETEHTTTKMDKKESE